MKRQHRILIGLAILILAVLVFLRSPEHERVISEGASGPDAEVLPEAAPTGAAQLDPLSSAPASGEFEAALQAHRDRQLFAQRVRDFFAHSEEMAPATREPEAAALLAQVDHLEARGELSAAEAVALRLGLLRSSADEAEFTAQAAQIIHAYQARHEQALAEYLANPPAAFVQYKARERAIVLEVQQMDAIPGGLSRGQYLRQRLQAAREESYAAVHRDD